MDKHFIYITKGTEIHLNNNSVPLSFKFYEIKRPGQFIYSYDYQMGEQWLSHNERLDGRVTEQGVVFDSEGYIVFDEEDADYMIKISGFDNSDDAEKAMMEKQIDAFMSREDVRLEVEKTVESLSDAEVVLPIIADTHYVLNGNWEYTLATLKAVKRRYAKDFSGVIHLGDFTDGILSKEICRDYSWRVIDGLKKLGSPLFIVVGNHDANYFRDNHNVLTEKEQWEIYQKDANIAKDRECCNGLCYSADIPETKITVIALSAYDNSEEDRYGYSDEEIDWLLDTLNSAPSDRHFLILSHDAPLSELDFWAQNVRNGENLTAKLDEWNCKNLSRIIAFIYGHSHADYVYLKRSFPIVSVGCSKLEYYEDKKPMGAVCPVRREGEVTQELWDTLVINPITWKFRLVRFGAGKDRNITRMKEQTPQIWAHRGASGYAPENTLEAFKLAVELGADGVELDVQFTKDRQLVVIHDERIDRTSNGVGFVADYTYDELGKFNFNKTHPEYAHCNIPLLEDVLKLLKPTDLTINIELKTGINFYPGIEEAVLSLVEKYDMQKRIVYSSFNHQTIIRIKELCPGAECGFLYADGIANIVSYAREYGIENIHPALYNMKYEGLTETCEENGIRINVWTVNSDDDIEKMRQYGVNAVITNYPDRAGKLYYDKSFDDISISTHQVKQKVQKKGLLHFAGETYRIVRKPFVAFDRMVQRLAGK